MIVVSLALSCVLAGCDEPPPARDTDLYASCYDGRGLCIMPELIAAEQRTLLEADRCRSPLLCAPRTLVRGQGASSCVSLGEAEGRCVLAQLPLVASQGERLPRSLCAQDERCVPCFDPLSGENTGACNLPGDPGPKQAPRVFGRCCGDAGRCLPRAAVPADQRAQLGREACHEDELCVPQFVLDKSAPPSCESVAGSEGRCLPSCLPAIGQQSERLPRGGCATEQLCAPCFDPLSGEPTGSCALPGDPGPRRAASPFATCCGGGGRCLPLDQIPAEQRDDLAQHECGASQLCAPQLLIDGRAPKSCRSLSGVEGRCLSSCLPSVQQQVDRLPRATCGEAERCVPCYDPFTGVPTDACSLPGDAGPAEPAHTFARCCSGAGSCVPPELVAESQRDSLAAESCKSAQLCVPRQLLESAAPASCASLGGFEGRCLPECLPLIASQSERLPRASCATSQRCAPCYDPFSGEPTGACSLPGDPGPSAPRAGFETCCEGAAHCVPEELVPDAQRTLLATQGCGGDQLCVPDQLTSGAAPVRCDSVGGAEGRCVSECVPQIAAQSNQLPRSSCGAAERCAPCYDPFSGEPTGSCELPGDPGPERPALLFPTCCEAHGRCVPPELVPEDKRSMLAAESCKEDALCLPSALIPPATGLPACTGPSGARGACVPGCLLSASQTLITTQSTCPSWARCVPCNVLGTPSGVCD